MKQIDHSRCNAPIRGPVRAGPFSFPPRADPPPSTSAFHLPIRRGDADERRDYLGVLILGDAEQTAPKQRADILREHAFKPGQSGNPNGRPKGARSKLGEAFINEMLRDFEENGAAAIIKVRAERPADYIKVVASILPKEVSGPDGDPIPVTEIRRVIVDPAD